MATPYNKEQDKKTQIEDMFDNIAPRYDLLNRLLSMRVDTIWRRKLVRKAVEVNPTKILDVACGTGDLSILLAKKTSAKVDGVDLSAGMVEVGRRKISHTGLQIDLTVGDAEKLPYPTASFDVVTCAFGVRNFENLQAGIEEMKRVLKPGGLMLILEFSQSKNVLFKFYFKHILPTVGGWISKDKRAYQYLPTSVGEFPSGEKFVSLLRQVGFKEAQFIPMTGSIATIYIAQ